MITAMEASRSMNTGRVVPASSAQSVPGWPIRALACSNRDAAPDEAGRNARWRSFDTDDIMSMPDKWEYPWFAAWDLAFHCVALAHVDPGSSPTSSAAGTEWSRRSTTSCSDWASRAARPRPTRRLAHSRSEAFR
jgi:hypothetical protein